MNGVGLQQRCWNHDSREAVCRCLACGRSFCRECVTEHESRLVCAGCLRKLVEAAAVRRGRMRRMASTALMLAGLLLAWGVFFAAGESMIALREHAERAEWQSK